MLGKNHGSPYIKILVIHVSFAFQHTDFLTAAIALNSSEFQRDVAMKLF